MTLIIRINTTISTFIRTKFKKMGPYCKKAGLVCFLLLLPLCLFTRCTSPPSPPATGSTPTVAITQPEQVTPTTAITQPEPSTPTVATTVPEARLGEVSGSLIGGIVSGLEAGYLVRINVYQEDGASAGFATMPNTGAWEIDLRPLGEDEHYIVSAEVEGYVSQPISYTVGFEDETPIVINGEQAGEEAVHLDFHFSPASSVSAPQEIIIVTLNGLDAVDEATVRLWLDPESEAAQALAEQEISNGQNTLSTDFLNLPDGSYSLVIDVSPTYFREPKGYHFQMIEGEMVANPDLLLTFDLIPPSAQEFPPCNESHLLESDAAADEATDPANEQTIICMEERIISLSALPKRGEEP